MKRTKLALSEIGLHEALLPKLSGRVFHVTRLTNLSSILASGQIAPNIDGTLKTGFGSSNSFFRRRGCICVFDLRTATPEQQHDGLSNCSPTQPSHGGGGIAILFLTEAACASLLSWHLWKKEQAWGEQIVPHIEAGHPGPISIDLIDEILCIDVVEKPNSLAALVRRAQCLRTTRDNAD